MTSANQTMNRPVSPSDKEDLIMALKELANMFHPIVKQLTFNTTNDYEDNLVYEIVDKAHCIFTVKYVNVHFPIFSVHFALQILEIFHKCLKIFQILMSLWNRCQ